MLVIVGSIIVLVAVLGGFIMAGGNVMALNQPSEYVVILGSAAGAKGPSASSARSRRPR